MASIKDIQQDIIDEFDMFDEWMGKYEHIIDLGKSLPLIEEAHKTEDNLIKGCQSRVWLHANKQKDKVVYTADSDAIMTKGIIALLVRTFSGQKAQDIVEADTNFINQIGLKEQLSPTRANGLVSMVKQMMSQGKNIKAVACASTGDTSASLAAYCAVAGIPAIVFLPKDKVSLTQLIQPITHGVLTLSLDTDFDG